MSILHQRESRYRLLFVAGILVLFLTLFLGVVAGSIVIPPGECLRILAAPVWKLFDDASTPDPVHERILVLVRLPRCLLAATVGALLALAGVQLQGLFRNDLADPSILGTSQGAALGTVLALATGLAARSALAIPVCAFLGAFATLFLLLTYAARRPGTTSGMLLLFGLGLNMLVTTLTSLVLSLSFKRYDVAAQIMAWLMGGLEGRGWWHFAMAAPCLFVGVVISQKLARELDLLLEGDEAAANLGVPVVAVQRWILFNAALLTGAAVAVGGVIGFVGLIIPHAVRLLIGPAHDRLIPLSALTGAWFVALADVLARTVNRPEEVQLGVVTACIGAPFFLALLLRKQRELSGP